MLRKRSKNKEKKGLVFYENFFVRRWDDFSCWAFRGEPETGQALIKPKVQLGLGVGLVW